MKLTNTLNMKSKSGMTLLELTVVILVLLSLISILFIGARAWKKGSDRAGCILNLRNIQQAVRGEQNMKNEVPGAATLVAANIIGTTGYITKVPVCPSNNAVYTYAADTIYPLEGVLYAACAGTAGIRAEHVPADVAGW